MPARVVTGYQGGERNTFGDYLIVRQSDAHAWAEVWLEGRGWTRVDPTGAVSYTHLCGAAVRRVKLLCVGIANHLCVNTRSYQAARAGSSDWNIPCVQSYRPNVRPHFVWLVDGFHRHQQGSYLLWYCVFGYSSTVFANDLRAY